MTAMTCFLEEAGPGAAPGSARRGRPCRLLHTLWALAQQERDRLIEIVRKVEQTVVAPECRFADESGLEPLIRRGMEGEARGCTVARVSRWRWACPR